MVLDVDRHNAFFNFLDSFILGSRLAIILNDLMWFFTDSQLKAALYFLDSLTDLIQKSTQITRMTKAARKLEVSKTKEKRVLNYFAYKFLNLGTSGISSTTVPRRDF